MGVRGRSRFSAWISGFIFGIIVCVGALALAAVTVAEGGFTVNIDVERIAREARADIEAQVAAMLPAVIEDMKQEVPHKVAAELSDNLGHASFTLYGVRVRLPEESLLEINEQIETIVTRELVTSLDSIDVVDSASHWGERGEALIAATLQQELGGTTLLVQPWPRWEWLEVPVTLQVMAPTIP